MDVIYLCFPNNPTGAVAECPGTAQGLGGLRQRQRRPSSSLTRPMRRFITEPGVPHSIFEIEGAKTCAIEFRSFSKTAGFTGTRCGYTVVPQCAGAGGGQPATVCGTAVRPPSSTARPILSSGARRPSTPSEGQKQVEDNIDYYQCQRQGHHGGAQTVRPRRLRRGQQPPMSGARLRTAWAPGTSSTLLLEQANVITTPGAGFGPSGEGYIRLTAFGDAEATKEAVARIEKLLSK